MRVLRKSSCDTPQSPQPASTGQRGGRNGSIQCRRSRAPRPGRFCRRVALAVVGFTCGPVRSRRAIERVRAPGHSCRPSPRSDLAQADLSPSTPTARASAPDEAVDLSRRGNPLHRGVVLFLRAVCGGERLDARGSTRVVSAHSARALLARPIAIRRSSASTTSAILIEGELPVPTATLIRRRSAKPIAFLSATALLALLVGFRGGDRRRGD